MDANLAAAAEAYDRYSAERLPYTSNPSSNAAVNLGNTGVSAGPMSPHLPTANATTTTGMICIRKVMHCVLVGRFTCCSDFTKTA